MKLELGRIFCLGFKPGQKMLSLARDSRRVPPVVNEVQAGKKPSLFQVLTQ